MPNIVVLCEGCGEGFQPELAADECPAAFGAIITDTAVPIEKGEFAFHPTCGLSFITDSFSPNRRRVTAGAPLPLPTA